MVVHGFEERSSHGNHSIVDSTALLEEKQGAGAG
jgi:hypothetical protein